MIKKYGFTLIEVLVAATIVGLLSTIGLSGYQAITRSGRDGLRKSDLEQIRSALEIYKSDNGNYPTPYTTCAPQITSYINSYPSDPKSTTYRYCYKPTGTLNYNICAHLENGSGTDYSTECGGTKQCSVTPGVENCNYKVSNP